MGVLGGLWWGCIFATGQKLAPPPLCFPLSPGCSCSVTQLCLTLCDSMDCSTPGFPVLHYLPEFAQNHVHWVSDAMMLFNHPIICCPLLLPSILPGISAKTYKPLGHKEATRGRSQSRRKTSWRITGTITPQPRPAPCTALLCHDLGIYVLLQLTLTTKTATFTFKTLFIRWVRSSHYKTNKISINKKPA